MPFRVFKILLPLISIQMLVHGIALGQRLEVRPSSDFETAIGEISVDSDGNWGMLQRSIDLKSWEDAFLVGPGSPQAWVPDQGSKESASAFFRIRALQGEAAVPTIEYNSNPGFTHFATVSFGNEVEMKLFGERDSYGLPQKLTDFSIRIGEEYTYFHYDEPLPTNLPDSGSSLIRTIEGGFIVTKGFVTVITEDECEIPFRDPVIEYKGIFGGSYFEETLELNFDHTLPEGAAYTYVLPYAYTGEGSWDLDPEQLDEAMVAAFQELFFSLDPDDYVLQNIEFYINLMKNSLDPSVRNLARSVSNQEAKLKVAAFLGLTLYEWDDRRTPGPVSGNYDIQPLSVRAVIKDSAGKVILSSPWENYARNSVPFEGNVFVLAVPCEELMEGLDEGDYQSRFNNLVKARVGGQDIFVSSQREEPDPDGLRSENSASSPDGLSFAETKASVEFLKNALSISFSGQCFVPSDTEKFYTGATGLDSGRLYFRIPESENVEGWLDCGLEVAYEGERAHAQAYLRKAGNNALVAFIYGESNRVDFQLRAGAVYYLDFGASCSCRSDDPGSYSGEIRVVAANSAPGVPSQ